MSSWFGLKEPGSDESAFARLWHGFMTARVMIALVLLILLGSIYALGQHVSEWTFAACLAYLAVTLAVRLFAAPRLPGQTIDSQWFVLSGVDVLLFSALQFSQTGNVNYAPLLALPVLLSSVLGSSLLALGTAAGATLLLLMEAWWTSVQLPGDTASRFLQAGLTGTGLFALAFLANQLAARLAREEIAARRSQLAARVQVQVNELVIETLADGVLVVDDNGIVRAANPAARRLLGAGAAARGAPFMLTGESAWQPLVELARQTFLARAAQLADIAIQEPQQSPRRIQVRTRLTATPDTSAEGLCVMFLQDLREMEARMRTDKLAAMGRMSAAVAHEIRNPLAAIVQANALLDEDLADAGQKQLSGLVRQNAQRLAQIVEEILNISRVQHQGALPAAAPLALDEAVARHCADWANQAGAAGRLAVELGCAGHAVAFDPDHLRRVLVNLLDNALRHAGTRADSIRVTTRLAHGGHIAQAGQCSLAVWSDGPPLEQTVQRHLFEPFFSSESRSSGLGLYICRELCERHGALIGYQRTQAPPAGNEFFVVFRAGTPQQAAAPAPLTQ